MESTSFKWILAGVLGTALAACGGGGDTSGGGATTTTSSGGSGGATTSTSTEGGGTTTSTQGGGGSGGATTTSTAEGGSGGATTTSSTTSTGPAYGFCAKPCAAPAECCEPGDDDCPRGAYPSNPECKSGACFPPQCGSTGDCTAVNPKLDCLSLSGTKSCGFGCAGDADCIAPLTCAGTDDDGKKYCLFAGGGCTDDPSCGGYGKCVNKVCVCLADEDCTAPGYSKCAL